MLDLGCESEGEGGRERKRGQKRKDPSFSPPRSRAKHRIPTPPLHVPKDILTKKKVVEALVLGGVSPGTAVNIFAAIVAESGGDLAYYNLSASHAHKQKKQKSVQWAEEKRTSYSPPESPIVLWDEKKMDRHKSLENRMPIAIAGDDRPLQHIGSILLADGTGQTIAKEVAENIAAWGVGGDGTPPVMQVWDTCSANSG